MSPFLTLCMISAWSRWLKNPQERITFSICFFLTNHPWSIALRYSQPLGQGDHDIVHHELKINLWKRKQKQRPIKLFKKTDWDGFRSEMKAYHQTFLENHSSCDTNTKWTEFKNTLNNLTEKYFPTKMCKPKDGHPWVTCSIKRLINKRDRLYSKYKQDRSNSTLKLKFTSLKHSIQNNSENPITTTLSQS